MKTLVSFMLIITILCSFSACSILGNSEPSASGQNSSSASLEVREPSTFTVNGVAFYPVEISPARLEVLDTTQGISPGERSETVREMKSLLYESAELEFISYSQTRPEVMDLFDEHLEMLVTVLYEFCQLEQDPQLDELTLYLLEALPDLPSEVQQDIYTVYRYRMIEEGIDGTLLRSGESLGLYYMAQTDPDWEDYPFPNAASPNEINDTARDRACGVMSMTMVASTYLHREIDPTELIDYVQENGYRITASGVDDTFMAVAAELYGLEEPQIYYQTPSEGQQALDWEYVQQYIDENNALGIVHETTGNFTPAQHYMVINDYVEIDGTGYFLISDPYQSRSRYSEWGTASMADPELGEEGVVYATPELLARASSAVILFEPNQDDWELRCQATETITIE